MEVGKIELTTVPAEFVDKTAAVLSWLERVKVARAPQEAAELREMLANPPPQEEPMEEQEKRPVGRPRIEIDYEAVEKLANFHCTYSEIASFLGCSVSRLEKDEEFKRAYLKGTEAGKTTLRRMQFKSAASGNVTMLIWLGKNLLGQTDKTESTVKAQIESGKLTYDQLQKRAGELGIPLPERKDSDDPGAGAV